MYQVDEDIVRQLDTEPQCATGAPLPHCWSSEGRLLLAYVLARPEPGREMTVVVGFHRPLAHMMGPPNDEAFRGHPLASRGLRRYCIAEVRQSSWIRRLERMNAVYPLHDPRRFEHFRHFVFSFHDSTFECVAHGFDTQLRPGLPGDVLAAIVRELKASRGLYIERGGTKGHP